MAGISRRAFLKRAGVASAAFALGQGRAGAQEKAPNFVFVLVDDLGWADLGCYGNTFHETPNIDRLATQGMRFTDAYAACPVCSPTRASIISGQYPAHVGITDFISGHWRPHAKLLAPRNRTQYLPLEITSIAETLGKAGYACAHFGKWHLGGKQHFPDKQGFDPAIVTGGWTHFGNSSVPNRGYTKEQYLSEVLTDEAEAFIDANQENPFFVHLAHFGVHIPLEAREKLIEKYRQKDGIGPGPHHPVYAAMVEHIDQSVGRIMKKLDDTGLAENTVLVVFSDNGGLRQRFDGAGDIVTTNEPLRGEKGSLYEGGIREPLIVRWPGQIAAGATCDTPVTSVDFYPTLSEIAGAPAPDQALDGVSLTSLLKGGAPPERDAIFWHYPHYHHDTPAAAIRQGGWKLIEHFEDGSLELYNLADDLGETRNLASEEAGRAAAMRKRLKEWQRSVGAAMPRPNPDYDEARAGEWGKYASKQIRD